MKDREFFQSAQPVGEGRAPGRILAASVGLHGFALLVLLLLPLVAPERLRVDYRATMLAPPEPARDEPEPVKLPPVPVVKPPRPEPVRIADVPPPPPAPKPVLAEPVRVPVRDPVEATPAPPPPAPAAAPAALPPKTVPEPAAPRPPVTTNVFSNATPAAPPAAPPKAAVAAGFGDAAGARGAARQGNNQVTASAGFGEIKATGPARAGSPGGATVGGFDGGSAQGVTGGTGKSPGTVASAGFGAPSEAPRAAPAKPVESVVNDKPAEILSKPRPEYTDAARKLRVEGEVLLRVLFTAAGEVRVLELVRGLGHGLDESATRAAEHIRFRPAERRGQPVDSTVIVHIGFQLAY